MKRNEAQTLVESLVKLRVDATDKTASLSVQAYPTLKGNGELVKASTRINWNNKLLRASVDLWDREENNPTNAPSLWEDIQYKEGYRIIPTVITVGTAFAKDECGWWNEVLYKSLIDNNTWTPTDYPQGWDLVELRG